MQSLASIKLDARIKHLLMIARPDLGNAMTKFSMFTSLHLALGTETLPQHRFEACVTTLDLIPESCT